MQAYVDELMRIVGTMPLSAKVQQFLDTVGPAETEGNDDLTTGQQIASRTRNVDSEEEDFVDSFNDIPMVLFFIAVVPLTEREKNMEG